MRFTADVSANLEQETKRELMAWLEVKRKHVVEQVEALPASARRRSMLPSGWTPLGLVRHLTLDVERVWFRAVMAGERVDLPSGYEGWTVPPELSDADVLAQYRDEWRQVASALEGMGLGQGPSWWFEGAGDPPYGTLREVMLHVLVETATHAGHLVVCRELVDGGQRLVLDEPT
ncbi:MAG: hypothetical protein QOK15_263 [Nocardioidaceae bacterium]|nr:hypothetical protein [Nocardioidaceae bacterium]